MSFLFPPPSTISVLSLSTTTRLAVPRSSSSTFSSFRPRSSLMNFPPVTVARSPIIALRRSPKPGAFTAQLVHDQRRQRLALDVFGDDQQRPAAGDDLVQQRQQLGQVRDLLLVQQ